MRYQHSALIIFVPAVALVTVGVMYSPWVAAVLVAGLICSLAVRSVAGLAFLLLIAGPLLGSRFHIGALTLDNTLTLAGLALALLSFARERRSSFALLSAFPVSMVLAIAFSGLANDVDVWAALVRYVGIAVLAGLVAGARPIEIHRFEGIFFTVLTIGAFSVILQPVLPFIPPYVDPDTLVVRFGGLFGHPNFAACSLGIGILFLLSRGFDRAGRWVLIAIFSLAVLSTGSLGAIAALIVGAAVVLLKKISWLIGAVVAAGIFFYFAGAGLAARLEALSASASGENSLTWRFQRWSDAIGLAPPFNVFGIGWEGVQAILGGPSHSSYVALFVELGLVGILLAVLGLCITIRGAGMNRSTLSVLLFVAISSVTDPVLYYPATMVAWVVVLGFLAAATAPAQAPDMVSPQRVDEGFARSTM